MKKLIIGIIMLLSVTAASAQDAKSIYNKYAGSKGVTAVYISPAMFKIIGKLPDMQMQTADGSSVNIAPLVSSFEGFYMLDISDQKAVSILSQEISSMVSKGRYELLMEVNDEGERLHIYTSGNEQIIESFVFTASEGGTLQFICIDGKMNRSDVEKLIASSVN